MKIVTCFKMLKRWSAIYRIIYMSQELENHCGLTYGNRMSSYACAASTAFAKVYLCSKV